MSFLGNHRKQPQNFYTNRTTSPLDISMARRRFDRQFLFFPFFNIVKF